MGRGLSRVPFEGQDEVAKFGTLWSVAPIALSLSASLDTDEELRDIHYVLICDQCCVSCQCIVSGCCILRYNLKGLGLLIILGIRIAE